jgi:hypothetical protein
VGVPGQPFILLQPARRWRLFKTIDGGYSLGIDLRRRNPFLQLRTGHMPRLFRTIWAGDRRSLDSQPHLRGPGHLQINRRRQDLETDGLEKTGRIGHLVIDPNNPDIVMACAVGHAYGPQPERGVFRTTDGGAHWDRVLFTDEKSGCSDLVMDPSNPRRPACRDVAA